MSRTIFINTEFAYRHLLQVVGFQIERLEWLDGYFATASFQLECAATWLPRRPSAFGRGRTAVATATAVAITRPVLKALSIALSRAELQRKHTQPPATRRTTPSSPAAQLRRVQRGVSTARPTAGAGTVRAARARVSDRRRHNLPK